MSAEYIDSLPPDPLDSAHCPDCAPRQREGAAAGCLVAAIGMGIIATLLAISALMAKAAEVAL